MLITAETPSSEPVNLAGEVARDRAIIVAVGTVGMEIERKAYYEKELDFRISRSYGPGRYDSVYEQKGRDYPIGYVRWTETRNMEAFLQLLAERKIDMGSLVTHRFPVDEAAHVHTNSLPAERASDYLGVVIQYSEDVNDSATLALVQEQPNAGVKTNFQIRELAVGILGAGGFAHRHPNSRDEGVAKIPLWSRLRSDRVSCAARCEQIRSLNCTTKRE